MADKLPPKEAGLFKSVVRFYEQKQYKRGLKTADQIIKKFPDHGETLSMKGLILNAQQKKDEAYEMVKAGLRHGIRSHICWHVYGLLYRSDRNYAEAIKCYRNALRIDPENFQILRDLALLQVQTRDLDGCAETRQKVLDVKSSVESNWISLAISHHLKGDQEMALKVLDTYDKVKTEPKTEKGADTKNQDAYQKSEMLLYRAQLLEELGNFEEALKILNDNDNEILDKVALAEQKGDLLTKLGRQQDAERVFRILIGRNPNNKSYHEKLLAVMDDDDSSTARRDLYKQLSERYPKSFVVQQFPLTFLHGTEWLDHFEKILMAFVRGAIPSAYSQLKPFFIDNEQRTKDVEACVRAHMTILSETGRYADSNVEEAPAALLWTKYFLARLTLTTGGCSEALELAQWCMEHTPTVVEFHILLAKIARKKGNMKEAIEQIENARKLDLADRYLNQLATKYYLRANNVEEAIKTICLFVREGDTLQQGVLDMQSMSFELEAADAFCRTQQWAMALKYLNLVDSHFNDFVEDQFDFHSYCVAKNTLRAYISMIRFEDNIFSSRNFQRMALKMLQLRLHFHDVPEDMDDEDTKRAREDERQMALLSPSERKKLESKKRREAARKSKAASNDQAPDAESAGKKEDSKGRKIDLDPSGEAALKKLKEDGPISGTSRWCQLVEQYSGDSLEALCTVGRVHARRGKLLQCLRALLSVPETQRRSPEFHVAVLELMNAYSKGSSSDALNPHVRQVFESCVSSLGLPAPAEWGTPLIEKLNAAFVQDHSGDAAATIAAAYVTRFVLLDSGRADSMLANLPQPQSIVLVSRAMELVSSDDAKKSISERVVQWFPECTLWK